VGRLGIGGYVKVDTQMKMAEEKKVTVPRTKGGLPDQMLFTVQGEGGETQEVDIFSIIRMTRDKPLSQISAIEAAGWLERISGYRAFLLACHVVSRERRIKAEDTFTLWWADQYTAAEKTLRGNRKKEVIEKTRTMGSVDPTGATISNYIISKYRDEWQKLRENIRSLELKERLIRGYYDAVDKYGEELKAVIRDAGYLLWRQ